MVIRSDVNAEWDVRSGICADKSEGNERRSDEGKLWYCPPTNHYWWEEEDSKWRANYSAKFQCGFRSKQRAEKCSSMAIEKTLLTVQFKRKRFFTINLKSHSIHHSCKEIFICYDSPFCINCALSCFYINWINTLNKKILKNNLFLEKRIKAYLDYFNCFNKINCVLIVFFHTSCNRQYVWIEYYIISIKIHFLS